MPLTPARKYKAAVVQIGRDVTTRPGLIREDMAANRDRAIGWIRNMMLSVEERPRLVVLGVLAMSGASRRRVEIDRNEGQTDLATDTIIQPFVDLCREFDFMLSTTCVEINSAFPGHSFHTGYVVGPDGLVLRQPKVQARSSSGITVLKAFRNEYARALGEEAVHTVVDSPIGKIGCIVESEQLVPEVIRALAKRGAEIVVHPNLEMQARFPYDAIKQVRAFENGIYLLSANAAYERLTDPTGSDLYVTRGRSTIAGPTGETLARCDYEGEGWAAAAIDLDHLDNVRAHQGRDTTPDWLLYSSTYS